MTHGVSQLAAAVRGPLYAGATLYIIVFGILILLGYIRAPIQDFVINVLKISIVILLSTDVGEYNFYVKELFFRHISDGIGSVMGQIPGSATTASSVSSGAAFDIIANQLIFFAATLYEQWTWEDWYPLVAAFLVLLGLIPIAALFAVVLLAKVGLTLILVLGPIFIALYLFRPTQSFTSAWVGALVNFVTLQVLSVTFITLLMSILTNFVKDAQALSGGAQIAAAFSILVIFVLALILALYLPAIAASIAGGGFQMGAGLIKSSINAARTTGGGAGRAGERSAQWGWNKMRGLGRDNTVTKTE